MKTENQIPDYWKITCSVPQYSISRPFMLLIYFINMPKTVKPNLFLDDNESCLIDQHKDVQKGYEKINKKTC